ncbi:hypothetical protein CYMTET_56909 [Cymbomonas tetramitiformis]|uniref:Uncharacterized protein n=1 Tax=Cymbomonas tetramitiformis TaxID=36881 RepID=A0AAE0BB91_9CHLO|nr:hypothetical protein CYMTET_56909 [Cymbomonas tetramitiformis]
MERDEDATGESDSAIENLRTMVLARPQEATHRPYRLRRVHAFAPRLHPACEQAGPKDEVQVCGQTPCRLGEFVAAGDFEEGYSFSSEDAENSVLAARFQQAIDEGNAEEFDALCVIAGGKPDIIADISACSFCEDDGDFLVSAVTEYTDIARHADTAALGVNTFIHHRHAGSVRGG